jgi:hypothetical protein
VFALVISLLIVLHEPAENNRTTADDAFHAELDASWTLAEAIAIPRLKNCTDALRIYARNPSGTRSLAAERRHRRCRKTGTAANSFPRWGYANCLSQARSPAEKDLCPPKKEYHPGTLQATYRTSDRIRAGKPKTTLAARTTEGDDRWD